MKLLFLDSVTLSHTWKMLPILSQMLCVILCLWLVLVRVLFSICFSTLCNYRIHFTSLCNHFALLCGFCRSVGNYLNIHLGIFLWLIILCQPFCVSWGSILYFFFFWSLWNLLNVMWVLLRTKIHVLVPSSMTVTSSYVCCVSAEVRGENFPILWARQQRGEWWELVKVMCIMALQRM